MEWKSVGFWDIFLLVGVFACFREYMVPLMSADLATSITCVHSQSSLAELRYWTPMNISPPLLRNPIQGLIPS